ncbi:MAG: ABC transporter permease [Thermodesulfobacteriota bacterium]|nr:ABC transporter permease [Thermodesulfobacteriota bacterium]
MNRASKIIALAIRSLLQHKLRAALSILGVICGVTAVLAMLSIGEGAKREVLSQIEQLGTKNIYLKAVALTENQEIKAREKLSRGLSTYDRDRIVRGCAAVRDVACLMELPASVIGMAREVSPQIVACSSNYGEVHRIPLSYGRFVGDQDVERKYRVCVLGWDVSESLGSEGRLGSHIRMEDHLYQIVGVLKRQDFKTAKSSVVSVRNHNQMIFVPLGTEGNLVQGPQRKGNRSTGGLTELVVQVQETDQVIGAARVIRRIMERSHGGAQDYQMVVPQELLRQAQKTQRTFNIVLGSIACISLLVGGIGIMNIMLATVSERTREIGIRRAVGAAREHIMIQFLAESVLLTFSGGIVGVAGGIVGVWLITAMAGWKTAITIWSIILSLLMSTVVGIFFGLYPAYHAAKMDPIAALRHE